SPAVSPAGTAVRVFALRQRASVYGHNAPMWRTVPYAFKSSYDSSHPQHAESWPDYLISTASETHVDLDAAYPAIAPGGFAVLARGQYDYPVQPAPSGTYVELYRIEAVSEVSREEFALSGKSTRLGLTGENHFRFRSHVRGTKVFAQSEELQFARYPVETAVAGDAIEVAVAPEGL